MLSQKFVAKRNAIDLCLIALSLFVAQIFNCGGPSDIFDTQKLFSLHAWLGCQSFQSQLIFVLLTIVMAIIEIDVSKNETQKPTQEKQSKNVRRRKLSTTQKYLLGYMSVAAYSFLSSNHIVKSDAISVIFSEVRDVNRNHHTQTKSKSRVNKREKKQDE